MGFTGFFFLALALAMDCFSVSITCGIADKRMGRQSLGMALLFGFFQALMPFIGMLAEGLFRAQIEQIDHWIAFGLLAFLGGKMIWEGFKPECDKPHQMNTSSLPTLLTLSVATSIDALSVGFTFASFGVRSVAQAVWPLVLIGVVSLVMSLLGKYLGVVVGRQLRLPAEPIGGVILLIIGVKVLFSHL